MTASTNSVGSTARRVSRAGLRGVLLGQITCTTRKGQPEQCSGEFFTCNSTNGECEPIPDGTKVETQKSCSDYEELRYWQSYGFDPLDLRDPGQPVLTPRLAMDEQEEGTSLLASGTGLYFNYQQPQLVANDPRAYVKRYFRRIDFAYPINRRSVPDQHSCDVIANEGKHRLHARLRLGYTNTGTMSRGSRAGRPRGAQGEPFFRAAPVQRVKPDGADTCS